MTTIDDEKKRLRKRMRALRLVVDQKEGPDAARAVIGHLLAATERLGITAGSVVAGYWPIVTELDIRPLLARLDERGVVCALPVVVASDAPLSFRRWRPLDPLDVGLRGTSQPVVYAPEVVPEVVLVPLLAFDGEGYRLGQGGGFYDRTLAALRACGPLTAVGVGFAAQMVEKVPRDGDDQPLDYILTEQALLRAGA
ncbi:MAG: 5-formyltetrahydrofolate cyclo-ligase [Rhodospirillales bacterium]